MSVREVDVASWGRGSSGARRRTKTSLDISGFRFARFAEGDIGRPRSVL